MLGRVVCKASSERKEEVVSRERKSGLKAG